MRLQYTVHRFETPQRYLNAYGETPLTLSPKARGTGRAAAPGIPARAGSTANTPADGELYMYRHEAPALRFRRLPCSVIS
jgi:hypothetical protein